MKNEKTAVKLIQMMCFIISNSPMNFFSEKNLFLQSKLKKTGFWNLFLSFQCLNSELEG